MLFFSESASDGRALADVADAFQRDHDEHAFEQRIARLIADARRRADQTKASMWSAAVERLKSDDHYLLVMLDQAGVRTSKAFGWRAVLAVAAALTGFVLFHFAVERYVGHAPSRDELGFFAWLTAVAFAAVYVVSRLLFGGNRLDEFLGRIIDACLGTRHR